MTIPGRVSGQGVLASIPEARRQRTLGIALPSGLLVCTGRFLAVRLGYVRAFDALILANREFHLF